MACPAPTTPTPWVPPRCSDPAPGVPSAAGTPPRTVPALHAPAVPAPAPLLQHARGQRPAAPARTPGQAPADACPAVQRAGAGWRSPVYPAVPGNPGADAQQLTPEHQPPAETVRTGRLGADPLQPDQHPRRSRPDPGRHRQPVGAPARVRITACPLRTGGGAPTKKPHPAPAPVGAPARVRMAARPVRTGAVLLQQNF